ncbi:MAG: diadenylate cyclase, partial [Clostridia bacterium]|nr:diadenylate cyclase [Clostridia bacterium]
MNAKDFLEQYIVYPWENFRVWDVLDWLVLTLVFYCVYLFCRGRIAGRVTAGLVLLWVFYQFTEQAGLIAMHRLMSGVAPFAVVLLAVIYQPELRDALARIGSTAVGFRIAGKQQQTDVTNTINAVVDAACQIATTAKDGALIVIERATPLGDFTDKGYELDAVVSRELLCTI